jgi:hypothetical protein
VATRLPGPKTQATFRALSLGGVLRLGKDGGYVIEEKTYRWYVSWIGAAMTTPNLPPFLIP